MRLDWFRPSANRGASKLKEAAWYAVKVAFFLTAIPWPSRLKVRLLRLFGAKVGTGVVIAPRTNIHMPWKLVIGDHSWIGQDTFLLNLEPIEIGSHCCISQRSFLCTGNHDYRSLTFDYVGEPIVIGDGSWVGAASFVAPGVTIGANAVVSAGSVVVSSVGDEVVAGGNPAKELRLRRPDYSSGE